MNNKKTSRKASFIFAVVWLVLLIALTSTFFFEFECEHWVQIVASGLLILVTLLFYTGGFYYVNAEITNGIMYIKHYNLFPVWRRFRMFQVPANRFDKAVAKKYFGGIICFVHIYENLRGRIARYPAIGFSAMPRLQRDAFIQFINSTGSAN
ncbi:MAG: hypothetical protein LBV41_04685 [Cytophagaceae bacterium]|jgi:hypothetical protein|nr:hypothetical protein [Cytophagaceae bacterium]